MALALGAARSGYLLDTNVLSETRRMRPDRGVIAFLSRMPPDALFISVLTLGELHKGIALKRRSDVAAADALSVWLAAIESDFGDRILPLDPPIARLWGELSARRTLPVVDTLIAATALHHRLTLVTRNLRDVVATGASLFDPFSR